MGQTTSFSINTLTMTDYEGEGMTRKSFWLTTAGCAAILAGAVTATILAGGEEDRVRTSYKTIERKTAPPAYQPVEKKEEYVVSQK